MLRRDQDSEASHLNNLDKLADLGSAPRTTDGLVDAWLASDVCAKRAAGATAAGLELRSEYAKAQYGAAFPRSQAHHLQQVMHRQNLLTYRNPLVLYGRALSSVLGGILIGLFWYKTPLGNYYQTFGLMARALFLFIFIFLFFFTCPC